MSYSKDIRQNYAVVTNSLNNIRNLGTYMEWKKFKPSPLYLKKVRRQAFGHIYVCQKQYAHRELLSVLP